MAPKPMLLLRQSRQENLQYKPEGSDPRGAACKIGGNCLKTKVNNLGVSMNVFIFITGSLVGAYYNTAVLAVASACAGACTKGASLILQLVA